MIESPSRSILYRGSSESQQPGLARLIVLSLLGDCAVELVSAIDRPTAAKELVVDDAVDYPTWHLLVECGQAGYEGALSCLKGTPHAKEPVSGAIAMSFGVKYRLAV